MTVDYEWMVGLLGCRVPGNAPVTYEIVTMRTNVLEMSGGIVRLQLGAGDEDAHPSPYHHLPAV